MPFGAIAGAIGIGSSLIGGSRQRRDNRRAEREQRRFIGRAVGAVREGRDLIGETRDLALSEIDAANFILADIEPALLEGIDDQLRVRVAQQVRQQAEEDARLNRNLAVSGLDASTIAGGVQRRQQFAQADAVGALGANFAGLRAQAIADSRRGVAGGLLNRANTIGQFGLAQADTFRQQASILGNVQIQAPNTGQQIGQFGGLLASTLLQNANLFQGSGSQGPQVPSGFVEDVRKIAPGQSLVLPRSRS